MSLIPAKTGLGHLRSPSGQPSTSLAQAQTSLHQVRSFANQSLDHDLVEYFRHPPDRVYREGRQNITEYLEGFGENQRKKVWHKNHELGQGAFGIVWLEQEESTKCLRAVKQIRRDYEENYKREIGALAKFSKEERYFAKFYGWYMHDGYIHLLLEYFQYQDLGMWMKNPFHEKTVITIAEQIFQGLSILHREQFVHRDLKPQNVFVASAAPNWHVKIGDFGCVKRHHGQENCMKTVTGTLPYQAPELRGFSESGEYYTDAVDIWSVGCIIYELLTHTKPFYNEFLGTCSLRHYCSGKVGFPFNPLRDREVSEEATELLEKLLAQDPRNRMTAGKVLQTCWVRGASEDLPSAITKGRGTWKSSPSQKQPSLTDDDHSNDNAKDLGQYYDQARSQRAHEAISLPPYTGLEAPNSPSGQDGRTDTVRRKDKLGISPAATLLQERTKDMVDSVSEHMALKLLKSKGYKLDSMNALLWAVSMTHDNLTDVLLADGVDIDILSKEGDTAQYRSARIVQDNMVRLLLEKGAIPNVKHGLIGYNILQIAGSSGNDNVVRLFLDKTVDMNKFDDKGYTVLHHAAENGGEIVMRVLLDAEVNKEAKTKAESTALHIAVSRGQEMVVRLLLEYNVDIEVEDGNGNTALHIATITGGQNVVRVLLDKGADPNAKNTLSRDTALHMASRPRSSKITADLVKAGASLNVTNIHGKTPLQVAAQNGIMEAVQILLKAGAWVEGGSGSLRPLSYAAIHGHDEIVLELLKAGADVKKTCPQGRTALWYAAKHGQNEVLRTLLEHGARSIINVKGGFDIKVDAIYGTPLAIAKGLGLDSTAAILREYGAK